MAETKTFKTCYRPLSTHWDWTRVRHWLPLATGTRGTYYQQLTQQPLGTHVHVFIYLFIYLFICLFIYLFICLFIYLFICLFIYLFSSEQARLYELRSLEDQWIETESNKIIQLPTPVSICTCTCIMYCMSVYIVCTCIMYCTSVYIVCTCIMYCTSVYIVCTCTLCVY